MGVATLWLTATASPAASSVTIGQLAASPVPCTTDLNDRLPQDSAVNYTAPALPGITSWTVTSWSHNAPASASPLTMKVFRKVSFDFYQVVGHDGPRPLAGGQLNTFPVGIPVRPGDILGLNTSGTNGCGGGGGTHLIHPGSLADGQAASFAVTEPERLNISALLVPSNSFALGKAKRNKKKGTATLTVNVPNVGELTAAGKGVKSAGAGAVISKTVTAPGAARLLIKAKGKKRRTLNKAGKVTLKPKITYTPVDGNPSTRSTSLKLKKR
jgi:hypothetical protein